MAFIFPYYFTNAWQLYTETKIVSCQAQLVHTISYYLSMSFFSPLLRGFGAGGVLSVRSTKSAPILRVGVRSLSLYFPALPMGVEVSLTEVLED